MERLKTFFLNIRFVFILYLTVTLLISLLQYHQGVKEFDGRSYTHYNNYVIFKNAYTHLVHYQNPYQAWPDEQWDLFKYSPTFALFMYPFTLIPDWIGLTFWNLINSLVLFYSIFKLNCFNKKTIAKILLFILPELIICLQNSQSNGLMAGLIVLGFSLFESGKFKTATFLISMSVIIKIFGVVAFILCIFYKYRWKAIVASLFWMFMLTILPALSVGFLQLKIDYLFWFNMLKNDHSSSVGLSVLGFLKTWFNYEAPKLILTTVGFILLLLPLLRWSLYSDFRFRLLMMANLLIWLIIFNHKAESPTYIIAITGAAIWYFSDSSSKFNLILLVLAFIFSSLSPTDLFPKIVRTNYVNPFVLKAVPFILIWIKISFDLLTMQNQNQQPELNS